MKKEFVLTWCNAINGHDAVSNGTVDSASQSAANRRVQSTAGTSLGRRMLSRFFGSRGA